MKLICKETCIGPQGRIIERGQEFDTGDVPAKEDRVAFELIASGRMLKVDDPDAQVLKQQIARDKAIAEGSENPPPVEAPKPAAPAPARRRA